MKEQLKKVCPSRLHKIYSEMKFWIRFHFFRRGLISEMFHGLLGYEMDWDNPQDMSEKIQWMKLNYDTSEWSKLADKYLVREYVKERIGEETLPKLYGVWQNANDINFETLPDRFVLKTNQGMGTVLLVDEKSKINIHETRKILNKWVRMRYGYRTVEPHYFNIQPVITAEEMFVNDAVFSNSLVDYKVYCTSGVPRFILVCTNREIGKCANFSYYDTNWQRLSDVLTDQYKWQDIDVPKPKCLLELLDYATKLSKGHPQVRVDFYIVKDKVYFGEMTFTPHGGYNDDITREFKLEIGKFIKLPIDKD